MCSWSINIWKTGEIQWHRIQPYARHSYTRTEKPKHEQKFKNETGLLSFRFLLQHMNKGDFSLVSFNLAAVAFKAKPIVISESLSFIFCHFELSYNTERSILCTGVHSCLATTTRFEWALAIPISWGNYRISLSTLT